jgi:hypothetical protein
MKLGVNIQDIAAAAVDRINAEYRELAAANKQFSLLELFNSPEFDFEAYCKDFSPHPAISELKRMTVDFANQYGILLDNAQNYITCAMFLFPFAPLEKIIELSKLYAVDFYLNDTMGREAKPTAEVQRHLYEIRDRLAALNEDLALPETASLAEKANVQVLAEIAARSPSDWFSSFLKLYLSHIDVAHKTYDAGIQTIPEYIDIRSHISGMPHTVSLVEYIHDSFLNWESLRQTPLYERLTKLNHTVSLIGALANDLFSFEKEVIDHKTDSNLIVTIVLNNFRMSLPDAIWVAGAIIRDLLKEYNQLVQEIEQVLETSSGLLPEDKSVMHRYLAALKPVLQACWTWQKNTRRYKRVNSIWVETSVPATIPL